MSPHSLLVLPCSCLSRCPVCLSICLPACLPACLPGCLSVCVHQVAIVGKGLTFDSGGYNLKAGPGSMIELMKVNKGGGGRLCVAKLNFSFAPCNRILPLIPPTDEKGEGGPGGEGGDIRVGG